MRFAFLAAGLLLVSPPALLARPSADPTRAQAEVPAARHQSALQTYRRAADPEPKPDAWRAANDTVTRIGGWRTYAREPLPGEAKPAAAPAPPAASKPHGAHPPHHHHGKAAK